MQLSLDDSRRLTGPNLFSDQPGAIIEVSFSGIDHHTVISTWQRHIRRYLDAVGWQQSALYVRPFTHPDHTGGASLVISAPIDVLYAATEVNEAAWAAAVIELQSGQPADLASQIVALNKLIKAEANPALLQLQTAADQNGQPLLSDDEAVSLGYGQGARVWPVDAIPAPHSIDWQSISAIPLALITGTNGKSTSVRLTAAVLQAAGVNAGTTSTDFIKLGDQIIDHGDYSGPGGAREILRHPDAETVILEVARGGILRRGLGVRHADAALITNVASDHLGQYGINTVADLIEAKFVVRRALDSSGTLVLNADDAGIVAYAEQHRQEWNCRLSWFSESAQNPVIRTQLEQAGQAAFIHDDQLILACNGQQQSVTGLAAIPITLNAAARHNVQNCLGVAALCQAIGISATDIATGLSAFSSDPDENPGRGNLFTARGFSALVDFAHNEHGYRAMAQTVSNLPAQRRLVMLAQAGDRSDDDIRAMTAVACQLRPDRMVICSLNDHLRGRQPGEVEAVIRAEILRHDLTAEVIHQASDTLAGVNYALDWAQPGDLLFLQVLTNREQVFARMKSL